ncbi:hypothetical protein HanRHA438_Chr09g0424501 [Helianthus annuus]|nr:hypothetical protein HanRHA438_Chr09g0424501 [Helianthus annuus]
MNISLISVYLYHCFISNESIQLLEQITYGNSREKAVQPVRRIYSNHVKIYLDYLLHM